MEEQAMLKGIKVNNITSYEELLEKYLAYVARVVMKVAGDRLSKEDVEEVCMDVFVKFWKDREKITIEKNKLKPYIGRMARNKTINALRNRRGYELLPFKSDIDIGRVNIMTEKIGAMGWGASTALSEDKTKLFCMVDLSGNRKLYGQDIVLTAKNLGRWKELDEEMTINLEEAYKQSKQYDSADRLKNEAGSNKQEGNLNRGLNQRLTKDVPELSLDKIEFVDGKLNIGMTHLTTTEEDHLSLNMELVDRRTNKKIESLGMYGTWDSQEGISRTHAEFLGLKEEDLPYLNMHLMGSYYETLVRGNWELKIELNKNDNIKKVRLHQKIKTDKQTITIKEIEVGTLGVKIEGTKQTRYTDYLSAYLQMKDGSQMNLTGAGMSTSFPLRAVWHLKVDTELGDREQINEVIQENKNVGSGTAISGFGESTISTTTIGAHMSIPKFIPLQEVQSIVIEGIEIPLR